MTIFTSNQQAASEIPGAAPRHTAIDLIRHARAQAIRYSLSNARFHEMHLVPDSEPICTTIAVSRIQFLRSEELHIRKSNSLEVACKRLKIEARRPEVVILGRPIYNHSGSQFPEPLL